MSPQIVPNRVDLPAPFGPITPRISRLATEKETLVSAANPPKETDTPDTSRTLVISLGPRAQEVVLRSLCDAPSKSSSNTVYAARAISSDDHDQCAVDQQVDVSPAPGKVDPRIFGK